MSAKWVPEVAVVIFAATLLGAFLGQLAACVATVL